ncbi:MAG: terminase small subunit [Rhodospirillales bacterium]|nr:terminase small subunit [Rhodospirillales bacterium]MDP6644201.1 terminase small subunit [Rhodospirillales bacterium]MDP6842027.1 terminase small subunit [Rhodospirillales bacterium]
MALPMHTLKPKHEAFAQAYARNANGAAAARAAGYGRANAASQASELLRRDDVAGRLAELDAEIAAARREALIGFVDKLEPVYAAALQAGDHDTVLQAVELQARITGLVHGGATVRPRTGRGAPTANPEAGHQAFLDSLDAMT